MHMIFNAIYEYQFSPFIFDKQFSYNYLGKALTLV